MVTEERLVLSNISGITQAPRREQWRESQYDLYMSYFHIVLDAAFTRLEVSVCRPKTKLGAIVDELDGLMNRTNTVPGYVFRPTKHAIRSAKFYIIETYAKMMDEFPRPSFVLDGEAGIVIKWTRNGHSVRLNCMAELGDQDYIYFENGEYDVEDNVTPQKLQNRLNWLLNQHA
jgi:hypothetical protein